MILLPAQISGDITYNGQTFKDFVPERTSAYINQYDEASYTLMTAR